MDDEKRRDLSRNVRWVARDDGDGLGYDIASFEGSGQPRLIEVKPASFGEVPALHAVRNELRVSKERADAYQLYRLYDFGTEPHLYILSGALDETCQLTPLQFKASPS